MQYRALGEDLTVSAVGLGCMGMSHAYGAPAGKKEMTELLAEAVDIHILFSFSFLPSDGFLCWFLLERFQRNPPVIFPGAVIGKADFPGRFFRMVKVCLQYRVFLIKCL